MSDSKETRRSRKPRGFPRQRAQSLGLLALACLLSIWPLQPQASPNDAESTASTDSARTGPEEYWPTAPDDLPPSPWLDDVRAQRRAWEMRHRAARDDYEAHRQRSKARGASHQDAWEQDLRRRRAERQERIDREREMFRRLGELPPGMPPGPGESSANNGYSLPDSGMFPPPGWNNLWYFRGF